MNGGHGGSSVSMAGGGNGTGSAVQRGFYDGDYAKYVPNFLH